MKGYRDNELRGLWFRWANINHPNGGIMIRDSQLIEHSLPSKAYIYLYLTLLLLEFLFPRKPPESSTLT